MFKKSQQLIRFVVLFSLSMNSYALDCETGISPTTAHFQANGGEVYDSKTDLTWQRCSIGQNWDDGFCSGSATRMSWQQALSAAESTELTGQGWRVPNIKELSSIVEQCRLAPSINTDVFPNVPNSGYWSSSPSAANPSTSWYVAIGSGFNSLFISKYL